VHALADHDGAGAAQHVVRSGSPPRSATTSPLRWLVTVRDDGLRHAGEIAVAGNQVGGGEHFAGRDRAGGEVIGRHHRDACLQIERPSRSPEQRTPTVVRPQRREPAGRNGSSVEQAARPRGKTGVTVMSPCRANPPPAASEDERGGAHRVAVLRGLAGRAGHGGRGLGGARIGAGVRIETDIMPATAWPVPRDRPRLEAS